MSTTAPAKIKTDVLVLGLSSNTDVAWPDSVDIPKPALAELTEGLKAVGFTAAKNSLQLLPAPKQLAAASVLVVGLGDFDEIALAAEASRDLAHETLRRAAGTALRSLTRGQSVAVSLPAPTEGAAEAAATGSVLGAYRYTEYLSEPGDRTQVAELTVLAPKKVAAGADRGVVLASATNRTRDLVNQPPLDLYPESFAETITEQAKNRKVTVTVLEPAELAKRGFGGLVGVGQGSPRGPRLVKLEYSPRKATSHLALVGKGITFDSGGLSLKPPASMETMKSDMAGAASVAQAVFAAADLGLPVKVTGWLAMAENLPGGNAQRPGDVIRIYGGKTVEVTNTDAEGRLVLADALVAAQEENPDLLIDVATLTGAQIVALGTRVSGVMGRETARDRVVLASQVSGEPFWAMPFPEEVRAGFDSTVADLKNSGKRSAGMLAAGIFLDEFVADEVEWAHLDIAGPSFNEEGPWGYTPKAATGVPVRTLVEVAVSLGEK